MLCLYKTKHVVSVCGKIKINQFLLRNLSCNVSHYDIIIAGGGLVGSTLACTLGKNPKLSGQNILLLDAGKSFQYNDSDKYSNRVVALNPKTRKLFNQIDVWKYIEAKRYGTVKQLQVWDAISDSLITFNNDDLSEPVAYLVENDLILQGVNEECKGLKNVKVMNESTIKAFKIPKTEEYPSVVLEDGSGFTCELLLGCDGVKSAVRTAMDVRNISWDHDQVGIVATLHLAEAPDNFVAWQRFLPTGPIALLPLKENLSSLVWSTTPQHAKSLMALSDSDFAAAINEAYCKSYPKDAVVEGATSFLNQFLKSLNCPTSSARQLPPKVLSIEENSRASFPYGFGHATNYVVKGAALVGDAAHRVHPLAGQGVNLGYGDVACLNELLGKAIYSGSKLNDMNYLKDYESQRQFHNVPTMMAIEGLHRLYKTDFTPIVLLRSIGLQFTHALTPIKKLIMNQAT